MEEYTLNGIRRDSIKRIFSVISRCKKVTRHIIAKETGLSLMTVGKITDLLLDHKAVTYEKASTGSVGRRAEYINLTDKLFELAIVITDSQIIGALNDFNLKTHDGFTLDRTGRSADEILPELMGEVMLKLVENQIVGSCIGVGVVYNDALDKDTAKKLAEELKMQLSLKVSLISEREKALSLGCALSENAEKLLYFTKNQNGYTGTLVKSGECILCGVVSGETERICDSVSAVCEFLSPDEVYIEAEKGLLQYSGEINYTDKKCAIEYAVKGASHLVREEYIQN